MPSPNLDRLCGAGVLHAEPPAADEFAGLLRSGLARLQPRCRLRFGGSKDQGLAAAQLMKTSTLVQKRADERSRPPLNGQMSQASPIPAAYAWPALRALDADALFDHDRHTLEALGRQPGTLALIFGKAQSKFREAKLRPGDGSQLLAAGGRT
jgi:type I restriction enzyme M protein